MGSIGVRDALTKAEAGVLDLVDSGLSNHEIAVRLSIGVGTVKCHLHRAYEKLQVRNRMQAVAKARQLGHLPTRIRVSQHVTLDSDRISRGRDACSERFAQGTQGSRESRHTWATRSYTRGH